MSRQCHNALDVWWNFTLACQKLEIKIKHGMFAFKFLRTMLYFFICYDCLFYTGSQGDDNLQAMLVGAMMRKIKSRNWKKQRYFKLEDDFMTIWYQSKKTGNVRSTCKRTVIIKEPVEKWPNTPDPTVGVLLTSICVCGSQALGIKHAHNLAQFFFFFALFLCLKPPKFHFLCS